MIKPLPISGFIDNLPENQLIEDNFKEIIKRNYSLSGFTPLDTPIVERLEILTSKGGDDNEIYGVHRLNGEEGDDSSLGLRFDLTVPLARYIGQYEGNITFPFRRQHIARVYRGERPQKGRFREFYQADVDIIGNGALGFFADIEVISTINNALKDLSFGEFVININNKKFLSGFLESIGVLKIVETIGIIDKKEKIKRDIFKKLLLDLELDQTQIFKIEELIDFSDNQTNENILSNYSQIDNKMLKEGIEELKIVYEGLLGLGIEKESIKINPSISRGLNYYTGTVFETFIVGSEKYGSIASGGRYENLASNFSKNSYPGVGGSIGLTRLLSILDSIGKINPTRKTVSKVLVLNMGESTLSYNLEIINRLRNAGINTEFYIDSEAKMQKQLKYANNKKIEFVLIAGDEEKQKNIVQIKNLDTGEQKEISIDDVINNMK